MNPATGPFILLNPHANFSAGAVGLVPGAEASDLQGGSVSQMHMQQQQAMLQQQIQMQLRMQEQQIHRLQAELQKQMNQVQWQMPNSGNPGADFSLAHSMQGGLGYGAQLGVNMGLDASMLAECLVVLWANSDAAAAAAATTTATATATATTTTAAAAAAAIKAKAAG